MPITTNLLGALALFGVFAGLSMVSGFRIESITAGAFLGLAVCGSVLIYWRRQCKANIGIVHHLTGWVLPLVGAVLACAWLFQG